MDNQLEISEVLDQVIDLTSEKDTNALELALAHSLFKLVGIQNVVVYTARHINKASLVLSNPETKDKDHPIPAELIEDLNNCLTSAQIVNVTTHEKKLTLFPIQTAKKQPLAVVVVKESEGDNRHILAIQVLRIYHNFLALMSENERDTLTGLLNRKTFDQKINSIISDIQHQHKKRRDDDKGASYLAIFDIDHFKNVNDTYGHLIGDEVLLMFSQLMETHFRSKDLLFRFGGEEFVGIYICPDDATINEVLNRFRNTIAEHDFPQVGKVTVSCGFTKIEQNDLSPNIIGRADTALYHAKNNGRNQVCQYEHLVAEGHLAPKEEAESGEIELF